MHKKSLLGPVHADRVHVDVVARPVRWIARLAAPALLAFALVIPGAASATEPTGRSMTDPAPRTQPFPDPAPVPEPAPVPAPEPTPAPAPEPEPAPEQPAPEQPAPDQPAPDVASSYEGSINNSAVNLRSGPGKEHGVITQLYNGQKVLLVARSGDWFQVRTKGHSEGWVFQQYVNRPAEADNLPSAAHPDAGWPELATDEQLGAQIVDFAMQYVGYPYVWGAEGPYAFDCSGFTKYVYNHFGIALPRTAEAQFNAAYGEPIYGAENLRPGDLVFFVNTYKAGISHVGIYAGDGQVVQAMSPALGIDVAPLNSPYWGPRFYAGLRPSR